MQSLSNTTLRTLAPIMKVPAAALCTTSAKLDQAYRIEADSFGELKVPAEKYYHHKAVGLWPCHNQGGNQYWMMSKQGEIRRDETCVDYAGTDVILYPCHGSKGNQYWVYNDSDSTMMHGSSRKCLAISAKKDKLLMEECSFKENPRQRWKFQNYDSTKEEKS